MILFFSSMAQLTGHINEDMLAKVEALKAENVKEISVTSAGGLERVAVEIGNWIYRENIAVKIEGYCLSACAQFLIAGSPSVRADRDAVVGFHQNSFGMSTLAEEYDMSKNSTTVMIKGLAQEQRDFYKLIGVDTKFLTDATHSAQPLCISLTENTDIRNVRFRNLFWVPSKEYLESVGINWRISSVKSEKKAKYAVGRNFSSMIKWTYGAPTPLECNSTN